ncbi:protein-export chaperone SecB [Methylococcus sp. EFPC2]|uniref:protein-export chaperone SecB n=1 Tax=Methylococcus sp. EFPC2 TaxID=2812648 RepID=UPI0019671CDC|nr:protein-export chaperone SecB [Methylococcus sp. EFPC2]QSA96019.1 protein-export chaperone SecB [Methylococcus sp. EFPC2]
MAEEEKQFALQKLYVKDVSFETPNSPAIFTQKWEPQVEFNLSSNAKGLQENLFEVSLTVTVTVKLEDKTAYLVEVSQAGIFTLGGFNEQELGPLLGSFCPNILFPYAREAVSDLVIKGGFPPLLLAPVNFDALYSQHIQQGQPQPSAPGSSSVN